MKTEQLKAAELALSRLSAYKKWLQKQPLSAHSKRAYKSRVEHFLVFLASNPTEYGNALQNGRERDFAVRDYKVYLKRTLKMQPTTVNSALTGIDHFYQFHGLERARVEREDMPQLSPRALSKEEQKRFVRAVERCRRSKDRAVAFLMFYAGLRIGECAALDVDDVYVIGRKNRVIVRNGKGDKYRAIPMHGEVITAVGDWLVDRAKKFKDRKCDSALFLNPQGKRMSTASLDRIIRKIAKESGLDISAHILRHSFLTNLVRSNNDLVLVAQIAGHKRLETTRRYTLPSEQDVEKAIKALVVE